MNKELTKEEILKKHYDVLTSTKDGNWASWDKVLEYGDAEISFNAMQDFAEQEKKKEAIVFAEWINSDECDYFPTLDDAHNWVNDNADKVTTEQLYELYMTKA